MKTELCDNCLTPLVYTPKPTGSGKYYIMYKCPRSRWYNLCCGEELYKSYRHIKDDYYYVGPDEFESLVAAQAFINKLD